jgi:hypothetical protein
VNPLSIAEIAPWPAFVKPPRSARRSNNRFAGKPRPKGGGTKFGLGKPWVAEVRSLRALLKALHAQCPPGVKVDHEFVGLDVLEHIYDLDRQSLHVLSMVFATLWRASNR